MQEVPDSVKGMIRTMVNQQVAKCLQLGISLEDFHKAMMAEQEVSPRVSVSELFDRTWARLKEKMN